MIRLARIDDLKRLTDIYNQAIATKRVTADMQPFAPEQRAAWLSSYLDNPRNPLLVWDEEGEAVGYCSLSAYRPGRQGLARVAEVSYYIDYAHHRQGIGNALLTHAIAKAKELDYHFLLAILFSCNEGSEHLLKKHGFQHWGTMESIVEMDEAIYSQLYYGLPL